MAPPMEIIVEPTGDARCIYGEDIDLTRLGEVDVVRASFVEPNHRGQWSADLSPVSGPNLGPFVRRSEALAAETEWLRIYWLIPPFP